MPEAQSRKSRHISYLLRFAVAGAALYLAFRGEDAGQVLKVLGGLELWTFVAAMATYLLSQLIFVARWSLLLKVHSIRIGYWPAVRLHFLGLFYNHCLPSAVGGDMLRAWYVTKHTDKKVEAAFSVFVDRVVGLTATLIMAALAYLFIPAQRPTGEFETRFAGTDIVHDLVEYRWHVAAAGLVLGFVLVGFVCTAKGRALLRHWVQVLRLRGRAVLINVARAIQTYWARKSALFAALLLAFCCQGLFIVGLWMIGRGLGVTAAPKYYFIFFPISWLLGALPISVGGTGITELWLKTMFIGVCGVSSELALALALSQRIVWLLGSLPGVVIHLLGAHLPKDFFVDYERAMK